MILLVSFYWVGIYYLTDKCIGSGGLRGHVTALESVGFFCCTCTSVRPVVALTSGGKGDVEAGADGSNFSDDPA